MSQIRIDGFSLTIETLFHLLGAVRTGERTGQGQCSFAGHSNGIGVKAGKGWLQCTVENILADCVVHEPQPPDIFQTLYSPLVCGAGTPIPKWDNSALLSINTNLSTASARAIGAYPYYGKPGAEQVTAELVVNLGTRMETAFFGEGFALVGDFGIFALLGPILASS